MEYFDGRKVVFQALTGSHNYNTATEKSDKDYKYFVLPSFTDLYHNNKFCSTNVSETVDFVVDDVRKLLNLFRKGNPAYLEMLFSNDFKCDPIFDYFLELRNNIVFSVRYNLYKACLGIFREKRNSLEKITQDGAYYNYAERYDGKQAHHALRCLYLLSRYKDSLDFRKAIRFDDTDPQRAVLMDIKDGNLVKKYLLELLDTTFEDVQSPAYQDVFFQPKGEKQFFAFDGLASDIEVLTYENILMR